jgi:transglutaminase-like putative cysteine protease
MNDSASGEVRFVDYRAVDWPNVRRIRCQLYQRFHYAYPGPIHNLKQRLIVIPADHYGAQHLTRYALSADPPPDATRQQTDRFGNRILELDVAEASQSVSFEVLITLESEAAQDGASIYPVIDAQLLSPTRLTRANVEIEAIARQLQAAAADPYELAQSICDWVYSTMRYEGGVTTVLTTAAEALALGRGLCQDYAHLMLAICRQVGLPARYVSGHLLGEGGSHAWVEVFLPAQAGFRAVSFDPTHNSPPHLGYITVAVGRDYADVSPTSGSFTAPYGGLLTCNKRAGLTFVEYFTGDVLSPRQ